MTISELIILMIWNRSNFKTFAIKISKHSILFINSKISNTQMIWLPFSKKSTRKISHQNSVLGFDILFYQSSLFEIINHMRRFYNGFGMRKHILLKIDKIFIWKRFGEHNIFDNTIRKIIITHWTKNHFWGNQFIPQNILIYLVPSRKMFKLFLYWSMKRSLWSTHDHKTKR